MIHRRAGALVHDGVELPERSIEIRHDEAHVHALRSIRLRDPAIRSERFVDAGGGEVVSELAEPIAIQALCEVLGVPNQWPDAMAALSEATFVTISARSTDDRPTGIEELAATVERFDVVEAVRRTDMAQLRNFERLNVAVSPVRRAV